MEPRFFDTHCHLDLMLSPDATANESAALGLGLFDCGIDPCDFEAAKSGPAVTQTLSRASASIPGGSPTAAAVLPKSICFAKLLPKGATSARWDSTFPLVLLEASRCKYRHLTGSAIRSCSILLPDA